MNKIAIDLGFIQIYWYSIFILLGMLVGMILVFKEAQRKGIKRDTMEDLVFWTVIFAVIGARLYYVIFNLDYYGVHQAEIFEIWNGGLAIHGGIIFGLAYLASFAYRKKIRILRLTDICAPGLIAGQIIGRWGNFFNAEAFGPECTREFLEGLHLPNFIIDGMRIDGVYHQPTFLYESLWNILGLIILLVLRRVRFIKEGQITGIYLLWYSIGRFFIEGLRQDSLMIGGVKVARIISIVLAITGLVLIWFRIRSGKFEHRYNDEETIKVKVEK
jgi:phosphatidylglycerol:prolipoprotein diacylglycerol transferase